MIRSDAEEEIVRRILELRIEHRDLDDAIHALARGDYVDQLQLKRLKKRKLKHQRYDRKTRKRLDS